MLQSVLFSLDLLLVRLQRIVVSLLLLDYEIAQIIVVGNSPAEIVSSRDVKVGRLICCVLLSTRYFLAKGIEKETDDETGQSNYGRDKLNITAMRSSNTKMRRAKTRLLSPRAFLDCFFVMRKCWEAVYVSYGYRII